MTTLIPAQYQLRTPTEEDVDAIIALVAVCDMAEYGEAPPIPRDDVLGWLKRAAATWLVTEANGQVIAFMTLWDNHDHTHLDGELYLHPAYAGHEPFPAEPDLESALVRVIEARARELAEQAPSGVEVKLFQGMAEVNQRSRAVVAAEGFTYSRSFWRMRIDMTAPPPAPVWPKGIVMRTYQVGPDDRGVWAAVEEAFHDHWGYHETPFEEWMERTTKPAFDPALWFLALDGDEIAGVTLGTLENGKGWVNKVAVRRPWRKQGLARALLRQAFGAFYARDITRVELGVDAQSLTGAQLLYQQEGMHPAMAYAIYEKRLRG